MKTTAPMTNHKGPFLRAVSGGTAYDGLGYWCPGCEEMHVVAIVRKTPGPAWSFNGNVEKPTFAPSVKVTAMRPDPFICHHYVRDGTIQFLSDCSHKLKGDTVPMVELSTLGMFRDYPEE